jgi:hypothetical protein
VARRPERIDTLYCSFCGKSQHEVHKLVAGPTVFICDECVDLCIGICIDGVDGGFVEAFKQTFPETWGEVSAQDVSFLASALGLTKTKPLYSIDGLQPADSSAFYLGPFVSPFNEIYEDIIKSGVEAMGLSITRADEIFGTRPIMQDIWESIFQSAVIIADVTGRNPNVLYEVGLAHALGKPTIMLTQNIEDVPFDLKHYRCVLYENTARGATQLSSKLTGTIASLSKIDYTLAARPHVEIPAK